MGKTESQEYASGSDNYRKALGCFATGVTIVSGLPTEGPPVGATVNSFGSVSLEPKLVLFSLKNESAVLRALQIGKPFAVSVLAQEHAQYCREFATPKPNKWDNVPHAIWHTGCPILIGSVAAFEGVVDQHHPYGDHVIIIGAVERMSRNPNVLPLVFYGGALGQFVL